MNKRKILLFVLIFIASLPVFFSIVFTAVFIFALVVFKNPFVWIKSISLILIGISIGISIILAFVDVHARKWHYFRWKNELKDSAMVFLVGIPVIFHVLLISAIYRGFKET